MGKNGLQVPETVKLQSLEGWHTLVQVLADNEPTALAEIINQVHSHRAFLLAALWKDLDAESPAIIRRHNS